MNLFLVNNDSTIDQIIQLPEYVPGRDFIICFNYLVFLRCQKEEGKHHFKFIEDILTGQDYQVLHSKTDQFAFNWYIKGGIDKTSFKGISFGKLVQIMFSRTYNISIKIKYAEAARKVIKERGDVKALFYDFPGFNDCIYGILNMPELFEKIARASGIEAKHIKADSVFPDPLFIRPFVPKNLRQNIYKMIKLPFKFLINGISDLRNWGKPKKKIYLFDYPNIENLFNYYPQNLIITDFNKRLIKWRIFFSGLKFLPFEDINYTFNKEESGFLRSLEKEFLAKEGNTQFGCDFMINGFDYSGPYKSIIHELILKDIPGLLKYAGQVKKGIRQANIKTILMLDCLDQKYRTALEVCKQEKIKTVFVDHGVIGHAQLQRVADFSSPDEVVTTAAAYNPYKFQSKLVVLGNPCFDPYPAHKRKKVASIKKVLFLNFEDNHYARLNRFSYQEKFYEQILPAIGELLSEGIEIYFRPHALDKDYYEYVFKFFGLDPSRIKFGRSGSFTDNIYDMDLLVTSVSTCFFEAQAAGVPAIFMEPHFDKETVLGPYNGPNGEEVLRVSTKEELVKLILSNQNDPQYLNAFLEKFLQKYAPLYMGPLDGMASKRIMEYVTQKEGL